MSYSRHIFIKRIQKYYFPVLVTLASTVYLMQRLDIYIPEFINNYLNDFLCLPIVLKVCLYAVRYIKSNESAVIPLPLQISITLLFIIYFESVLPRFNARYTGDILDLIAYSGGLFLFMLIEGQVRLKRYQVK